MSTSRRIVRVAVSSAVLLAGAFMIGRLARRFARSRATSAPRPPVAAPESRQGVAGRGTARAAEARPSGAGRWPDVLVPDGREDWPMPDPPAPPELRPAPDLRATPVPAQAPVPHEQSEPPMQPAGGPGREHLGEAAPQTQRGTVVRLLSSVVAGPFSPVIVALWILIVLLLQVYGQAVSTSGEDVGSIIPASTPALAVERNALRQFGIPVLSRTVVVQRDPQGLARREQRLAVERAVRVVDGRLRGRFPDLLVAMPLINEQSLLPVAREDETTIVTYLFFGPLSGWRDQRDAATRYGRSMPGPDPSFVGVTGLIPARIAQDSSILDRLTLVELATVVLIALIIGIAFRSVVAPLITIGAGLTAYLTALKAVLWAGERLGFPVPPELRPLMVVLLFGIVTDYAVFLLSGVRVRLAEGAGRKEAARSALADYGPVIVTAGLMVAAGAATLLLASTRIFRAFGPGTAFTVLVGLVVAVTLVPAALAILGRLAYWPSDPQRWQRRRAERAARRHVLGTGPLFRLLSWRPTAAVVAVAVLALLLGASLPLRHATLGFDVIGGLPADAGPRVAAEATQQGFSKGILSPTEVVVSAKGITRRRQALSRLEDWISGVPGVAGVLGPRELPPGVARLRSALQVDRAFVVAPDGNAARYVVVFAADPTGSSGIAVYDGLRARMPGFLEQAGLAGATASYAGDTAIAQQTIGRTVSDLLRIAIAVAVVDLILLVLFLRAFLAPLYLVAASVLALTASAGITMLIFQRVLGVQDFTYYVPFAASVLLVSLGSDYNIFLVGRIWDEARDVSLPEAVRLAAPRATRAISIAAFALGCSFALLALVDITAFRQLAVLLAVGVFVDAFIVRALLVPSLITLFGGASAWPSRLGVESRSAVRASEAA